MVTRGEFNEIVPLSHRPDAEGCGEGGEVDRYRDGLLSAAIPAPLCGPGVLVFAGGGELGQGFGVSGFGNFASASSARFFSAAR